MKPTKNDNQHLTHTVIGGNQHLPHEKRIKRPAGGEDVNPNIDRTTASIHYIGFVYFFWHLLLLTIANQTGGLDDQDQRI